MKILCSGIPATNTDTTKSLGYLQMYNRNNLLQPLPLYTNSVQFLCVNHTFFNSGMQVSPRLLKVAQYAPRHDWEEVVVFASFIFLSHIAPFSSPPFLTFVKGLGLQIHIHYQENRVILYKSRKPMRKTAREVGIFNNNMPI